MMSAEQIRYLIDNLTESLDVEVKNWLGGLSGNEHKARLAKEIIALGNHGGGYVFIGFDDEAEGHPEIAPEPGELEGYSQDAMAGLVQRYVSPPCQCTLGFYSRAGSTLRHPVITVPGSHRTPLWAARASPDEQTLRSNTVYVRRPGGFSEPARTQDDWERLLERLIRARQAEQLDAIRNILNPAQTIVIEDRGLDEWTAQSLAIWQQRIAPLPPHDNRRFETGFWLFSFQIEPFSPPSLITLNQFLERETPRHSGWRPFTYLHGEPRRPQANGDFIEAWLAESHDPNVPIPDGDAETADFWRVSKEGKGFLLRPMQEDRVDFLANRYPRPEKPNFDFILPPYRAVELLKFVQALGERFSDENANFDAVLRYVGTRNRTLVQHELRYHLHTGGRCQVDQIEAKISGQIFEIENNLPELIFRFLTPVFEQFEFTELPMALVENQVREALGF